MGTTADKLAYLNDTKLALKTAINGFDDTANPSLVDSETTFRDYASKVTDSNMFISEALTGYDAQLSEILGNTPTGETPKDIIVNAVNERGGNLTTSASWSGCANEIRYMDAEWAPDRLWPDIVDIITADPSRAENGGSYFGAYIVLSYVIDTASQTFVLNGTTAVAIKTSDGSLYTFVGNGASVTHVWDVSTYVVDSEGKSCRWIIVYQSTATLDVSYASAVGNISTLNVGGLSAIGCLYVIFATTLISNNVSMYNTASLFFNNFTIEGFDFIEPFNMTTTSNVGSYFCKTCRSLCYIPWNKIPNSFSSNSFAEIRSTYMPSITITSLGGVLTNTNLKRVDSITTSGSNSGYLSQLSLNNIPYISYLDMSSWTIKGGETIFSSLYALRHCLIKLPYFTVNLSSALNLDIESLIYLCDNAPDVTSIVPAPTLTLGAILQTRVGAENLSKLITKGWTVA